MLLMAILSKALFLLFLLHYTIFVILPIKLFYLMIPFLVVESAEKRGFKISSMVEKFNFMSLICLDYHVDFLRVNFLKLFRPAFCSTYSDECFCSFQVFMRFYQCSQSSHSISAIKYHNNNLIWLLNKYGFLTCSCSVLWNGCPKEKSEYISETVCGLILFW